MAITTTTGTFQWFTLPYNAYKRSEYPSGHISSPCMPKSRVRSWHVFRRSDQSLRRPLQLKSDIKPTHNLFQPALFISIRPPPSFSPLLAALPNLNIDHVTTTTTHQLLMVDAPARLSRDLLKFLVNWELLETHKSPAKPRDLWDLWDLWTRGLSLRAPGGAIGR